MIAMTNASRSGRPRPTSPGVPADVPPRRRRDDGPALARVGPGLGRRGRGGGAAPCPKRFAALFMGSGINPTTGGPRAPAPTWSWADASSRWRRCKTKINVVNGLFNKHATGVGIHPGQTGNILSGAALAEGGRAEGRHQRRPGAGQRTWARRPSSRAWSWAASSRSPATTRRTSRWPTARTSPGRAPTSPVPMEVYPSLAFDSLFDNRGSRRNQSILDRVRERGRRA